MPTIIALNPRGKGKKKKKKKQKKKRKMSALQLKYFGTKSQRKKSAKKRGKKKMATKKRKMTALQKQYFGTKSQRKGTTVAKRKTKKRSNPKKKKGGYTKRAPQMKSIVLGAAKSLVPLMFGALVAKFAAKKFADGGSESENWNWKNYAFAGVATVGVALLAGAVLKKKVPAQKILEGGLLLLGYKLFTHEIAPMNTYTESWFGGAEDDFNPYSGLGEGEPGDLVEDNGETFIKGIDGYWRPASESHRLPAASRSMGDVMVNPDPRYGGLGEVMVQPNARYGATGSEIEQMIENDQM